MPLSKFCSIEASLYLYYTSSSIASQIVPSTKLYVPQYVGSGPVTISSSCPAGYQGGTIGMGSGTCTTACGDGLIAGTEECDDENTASGDGCSNTCTIEHGFS